MIERNTWTGVAMFGIAVAGALVAVALGHPDFAIPLVTFVVGQQSHAAFKVARRETRE